MSAPRVRVKAKKWRYRNSVLVDDAPPFSWMCTECERTKVVLPARADTIAAASDAGRAHLAAHHTAQMPTTPVVQTIVSSTRCTCGDLPRSSYPWFTPCPVHSYLVNTTTAQMPPVAHPSTGPTYCRQHGTHVSDCRSAHEAHGDPDCLNVPQNAIQRAYDTTRSTT
jgi:hypothetical protein